MRTRWTPWVAESEPMVALAQIPQRAPMSIGRGAFLEQRHERRAHGRREDVYVSASSPNTQSMNAIRCYIHRRASPVPARTTSSAMHELRSEDGCDLLPVETVPTTRRPFRSRSSVIPSTYAPPISHVPSHERTTHSYTPQTQHPLALRQVRH